MFWIRRRPYARWVVAAVIVLVAVIVELSGRAQEPYPFAARDVRAGEHITGDMIEWRSAPAGLLPVAELDTAVAARAVTAGEPLTPGVLTASKEVPSHWWAVSVPVPTSVVTGTPVRLVLLTNEESVDGIVVTPGEADALSSMSRGLVAVPPELSTRVAAAAAADAVVTLIRP